VQPYACGEEVSPNVNDGTTLPPGNSRVARLLLALARAALLLAALGSMACGWIAWDGLRDREGPADVGVVLGSLVTRGGEPTGGLAARLGRGLEAWRAGRVPRLIVSGGVDHSGRNEAPIMRRWLLARGVPDSCVVEDDGGQNTWLTARNTARWMRAHGARSVLVVSDYYHLPRCRLAFARHGVRVVRTAHSADVSWLEPWATAREAVALIKYALRRDV
jgi:uncharacterized SAM-binding protein YcdF (DUF218 family)